MAHSFGTDETASSSFSIDSSDAAGTSFWEDGYELELQWGRIERLSTVRRVRSSLFRKNDEEEEREVIDVTNLGALERHVFIEKLITKFKEDNLRLLKKLRERIDGVGLELRTIEVRSQNLCVEAECEVVHGRPLPTLWNSFKGLFSYWLSRLAGVAMSSATVLFAPGPAFGHWVFKKSAWLGSKDGSWG